MGTIGKGTVAMNGLLPSLEDVLKEWHPEEMKRETQYRDALLKNLRESVPDDCRVEREYRHEGTTADLYLSWKGILQSDEVFFEIKRNLKRKSDYDRLVGQIEGLNPKERNVVVVLVGEVEMALVGRLRERYKRFTDDYDDQSMLIVQIALNV